MMSQTKMPKGMRIIQNWQQSLAGLFGPVASQLSSSHLIDTMPIISTCRAHMGRRRIDTKEQTRRIAKRTITTNTVMTVCLSIPPFFVCKDPDCQQGREDGHGSPCDSTCESAMSTRKLRIQIWCHLCSILLGRHGFLKSSSQTSLQPTIFSKLTKKNKDTGRCPHPSPRGWMPVMAAEGGGL